MATEGTTAPMASTPAEGGERSERGRGGRGGGGGYRGRGNSQGQGRGRARGGPEGENGRARRGDGRPFRGGGGGGRPQPNDNPPAPPAEVLPARASLLGKAKETLDPDVDAEVCFICASDVVHHSVAPCNHRTCHICALRMRALYKDKNCAHCRTAAESVIFTDDATKRYEEFTPADIQRTDNAIGIQYENMEIFGDVVLLLQYNCPDAECDVACISWPDLHNHVKVAHQKMICDLCSRHKKVFTHEHDLYTDKELQQHMRKGDDTPGAVDQTGFKGHPLCSFCGTRFYGNDELYEHCKFKHERCHICEKINGGQPVYFVNTNALQAHHKKEHYPCPEKECVDMKVIVFETLLDLKAHQISEHTDGLKREARAMDISNFDYRPQYVPERRGGRGESSRGGGTRGRGRDPNAEPIPASTAQPLRRDELAFQRQLAIHSAQSVAPRTFGGQLSAAPAAAVSRTPTPQSQTLPPPSRNAENAARQAAASTTTQPVVQEANLSPQEQARVVRHRAVIERAENLLLHDDSKVNRFRTFISNYKNGSISAKALIDSFFALFSDTSSTALGTLIQEVADLFEDRNKATNIRTAWNDWRAINEDYPSLPGPASMGESTNLPGMGWATITGSGSTQQLSSAPSKAKSSRVLKLKSSTVQSSRSQALQSASWGAPSPPPARSAPSSSVSSAPNAFPSLSSSSRAGGGKVSTTPWVPTPTSSNPGSARPTPPTSRPASRAQGGGGGDNFPALPPAAKPQSTIFGYGRGMVRRDHGTPVGNSFSWGGTGNGGAAEEAKGDDGEESSGGKKKGNKGKKQVLLAWG